MNKISFIIISFVLGFKFLLGSPSTEAPKIQKEDITYKYYSEKELYKFLERYEEPYTDIYSLIFVSQKLTPFKVMKELRRLDLIHNCPYREYKLLNVVSENELIFEATTPKSPLFKEKYDLVRLVLKPSGLTKIELTKESKPHSEEEKLALISQIRQLELCTT